MNRLFTYKKKKNRLFWGIHLRHLSEKAWKVYTFVRITDGQTLLQFSAKKSMPRDIFVVPSLKAGLETAFESVFQMNSQVYG